MSGFDGNGNYVRPYNWTNDAANGQPISAAKFDTDGSTVQGAFNLCLTRDGQGKPTGALSWLQTLTLAPGSGVALRLNGVANTSSELIVGSSTSGQSLGLTINAGTTSADYGLLVTDQTGVTQFFKVSGQGITTLYAPATAVNALIVNAATNAYGAAINGSSTTGQSYGLTVLAGTNGSDLCVNFKTQAGTSIFTVNGNGQAASYEALNSINALKNLATYDQGTFTGTLTGCSTAPTGTFYWSRNGNAVTIDTVGTLQATSNATTLTVTGLPAALTPARTQRFQVPDACMVDNTSAIAIPSSGAFVNIAGTTLTFAKNSATSGWTASGTKGIQTSFTFTYNLT
jgi:hypothetical protein